LLKKKREKRKHIRTNALNKNIKTNGWEQGIDENIINLSKNGCKFKSNIVYRVGDSVIIEIDRIYYIGTIIYRKGSEYGVEFLKSNK
jgi:hypothetical protein